MILQRHSEAYMALPNSLFISGCVPIRAGRAFVSMAFAVHILKRTQDLKEIHNRLIKNLLDKLMVLFYNSDAQIPIWFLHIGTIIKFMSLAIAHKNLNCQ